VQRSLHVEEIKGHSVSDFEVEIVERKGKGHPDSLIDGASEAVSLGLSRYYLENFGAILHHNVDKGILVGGKSEARFGAGTVIAPIYLMVAGRATETVPLGGKEVEVPVEEIARQSIRSFMRETMRFLDPDQHVVIDTKIKQGSKDLVAVFMRKGNPCLERHLNRGGLRPAYTHGEPGPRVRKAPQLPSVQEKVP